MKRKRILSFFLSLIMILGTSSVTVYAQPDLGDDQGQVDEMPLNTVRVNGRNVFYGKELDRDQVIEYIKESDEKLLRQPARGFGFRSARSVQFRNTSEEIETYDAVMTIYWDDMIQLYKDNDNFKLVLVVKDGLNRNYSYRKEISREDFGKPIPVKIASEFPDWTLEGLQDDLKYDVSIYYKDYGEGSAYSMGFTVRAHTGIESRWYDTSEDKRPDEIKAFYTRVDQGRVSPLEFTFPKPTGEENTQLPTGDVDFILRKRAMGQQWLHWEGKDYKKYDKDQDREIDSGKIKYLDLIDPDAILVSRDAQWDRYRTYIKNDREKGGEIDGKGGRKYFYDISGGPKEGFRYDFRQKLAVKFDSGEGYIGQHDLAGMSEEKIKELKQGTIPISVSGQNVESQPIGHSEVAAGNDSLRVVEHPLPNRDFTEPKNKKFIGWTTVLNEESTKVNPDTYKFTDDTTLYAFYKDIPQEMVSITVATADTTNSTAKAEGNPFEVVKGSKFTEIEEKATDLIELNTGYAITGWQVDNAAIDGEKEFNADTTVTAQIGPKTDYSYTVKHLKENTTESLAAEETVENQKFGETITVRAKTDIAGYEPVKAQETITIGEGENVVTFYYREKTKVEITYAATEGGKVDPDNELLNPDLGEATGSEASATDEEYAFVNWTTGSGEQLKKVSEAEKFVPTKPENGPWEAVTYTANFKKKAVETVPKGDEDYYVPVTISAGEHGGFDPAGNKTVHVLKGKATAADAFKLANLDIVKNEQGTAVGLNVDPGWSFVNYIDGQGVAVNPGAIINAEVGYTAVYKEKDSVTITYEAKPVDGKAVGKVTLSHENLKPATDTEAKGSAARVINLDYAFINWTDQANTEVSKTPGFKPTRPVDGIWKEATYTANFKKKAVTENPKDGAYVEVTINSGDKGVFKADSSKSKTVHVLKDIATVADAFKEAKLDISGQDIKIDDPYSVFDQYKDQTDNRVNADTQIGDAITITAHYKDSVVVVPDQNKPGDPKAGYIKVEFKPVENGTISADRIFFVKQNAKLEEAKDPKLSQKPLVVPAVSPKAGYKHVGWKEAEEAVAAGKQKLKALFPAPSIKVSADKTYNTQLTGYGPFVKNVTFEALYSKVTTAVDKGPTLPIYLNWKDIQHFVAKPVAKAEPKVEPAAPQLTVKPAPVPATGESRAEAYTISAVLLTAGLALLLLRRSKR